jgi:mono/diheme cytochrome c family protein
MSIFRISSIRMDLSSGFRAAALLSFTLAAAAAAVVVAQEGPTVWDGVYTQDQATRGQAIYKDNCQACHGDTLGGTLMAPTLTGDDFMGDWVGRTVAALAKRTQATMPADDPGKLTPQQVADTLAYVFAKNSLPAGQKELAVETEALNQIRITPKK